MSVSLTHLLSPAGEVLLLVAGVASVVVPAAVILYNDLPPAGLITMDL